MGLYRLILLTGLLSLSSQPATAAQPVGHYNKGSLKRGISLFQIFQRQDRLFHSVSPEGFQYGTKAMQKALHRIASWTVELTGKPLKIGDIAKRKGGKIAQHVTHQTGLDVDLGYLTLNPKKRGHRSGKFHNKFSEIFDRNGQILPNFDPELHHQLFTKIVATLPVKAMFVSCGILESLKTVDAKAGKTITPFLRGHDLHNDHFHLRLSCPKGAKGCSEQWWKNPGPSGSKKKKRKSYRCPV